MSDIDLIKGALNQWLEGLDSGNLEQMIATCDPDAVLCNQNQPTTVGVQAVRDKYEPRIKASTFVSGFDLQHIKVYGDFALAVGRFSVEATDKASGKSGGGQGRLVLGYRRHPDGSWKMLLDVDNNDEIDAAAR